MTFGIIPHHETGAAGPLALIDADPGRLEELMDSALRHYGPLALHLGDRLSRRWLASSDSPYGHEIDAAARRIGRPGAHLLNLSYEWTCTTGVGADPAGTGQRMLRTLDWPLDGLGRNVVVASHLGPAGPWLNVTWPGFLGVATALAPGRFAAAINQPPMRRLTPSCWLDWAINRWPVWRSRALPPAHLLRRVFETAATYADARAMLTLTPLAMPALFTLAGIGTGEAGGVSEGCVIERRETAAAVSEAPASIANHWIAGGGPGRARGDDSEGRWRMMEEIQGRAADDFSWLGPPILNPTTRLAVIANAAKGSLSVQGFEKDGPATEVFRL